VLHKRRQALAHSLPLGVMGNYDESRPQESLLRSTSITTPPSLSMNFHKHNQVAQPGSGDADMRRSLPMDTAEMLGDVVPKDALRRVEGAHLPLARRPPAGRPLRLTRLLMATMQGPGKASPQPQAEESGVRGVAATGPSCHAQRMLLHLCSCIDSLHLVAQGSVLVGTRGQSTAGRQTRASDGIS
jgi:hypothetical protein